MPIALDLLGKCVKELLLVTQEQQQHQLQLQLQQQEGEEGEDPEKGNNPGMKGQQVMEQLLLYLEIVGLLAKGMIDIYLYIFLPFFLSIIIIVQ